MKLGWNLRTGLNRFLSSWKSDSDPSTGSTLFGIDRHGYPQAYLWNGKSIAYRSGPWNGLQFSGFPEMKPNYIFDFNFTSNAEELYYSFYLKNESVLSRLIVSPLGTLQRFIWQKDQNNESWNVYWYNPKDQCDDYSVCGGYECESACRKNCSCTGYANSKVTGGGTGCLYWTGDLIDIRMFSSGGQDLYLRVAASDLAKLSTMTTQSPTCNTCLLNAIDNLSICCGEKQRGRALSQNYNIRYEVYPFYQLTTSASAPSPIFVSPPLLNNRTSISGELFLVLYFNYKMNMN
ncbi:hypothetical protein NE237_001336 [Protea cynaroides]|uniref:Gnk2-homologous domain-containing protein n=1 Tax=Protea cynaroides TaxID=273540 RepID=A0A9Q0QYD5_9MAGN|nr:hypothetical protein NE237_001336 [Protea cynaroides]